MVCVVCCCGLPVNSVVFSFFFMWFDAMFLVGGYSCLVCIGLLLLLCLFGGVAVVLDCGLANTLFVCLTNSCWWLVLLWFCVCMVCVLAGFSCCFEFV